MPYKNIKELPKQVRDNLPQEAQKIYMKAYNNAFEQYKKPEDRKGNDTREEASHKVAWSAVKTKYKKNQNDNWVKK